MTLTEKIKALITTHRLTPSHFADEIGIQRSSISHILSGRNRPSLDIVQRIVSRFPDITYEWLLEDDSTWPEHSKSYTTEAPIIPDKIAPTANLRSKLKNPQLAEDGNPLSAVESNQAEALSMPERRIERILIFYSDNTYTEYISSSKK